MEDADFEITINLLSWVRLAEPRNYQEILDRGYLPGRDLRIEFGDGGIERCLVVAPHGGGIEPGTSEIRRAISELGDWAWYEFAGFLRRDNHEELHITSTLFDEPTLLGLLPRTNFVLSLHGCQDTRTEVAYVGGSWEAGCETMTTIINAATKKHGIRALVAPANLSSRDPANLTNRGKFGRGIQLEFSRGARNLMFPPDCSREARGRRNPRLNAIARAIHAGLQQLAPG
jgi:phage replication-related protein YjqB (UPF0714/DUF867 family)